MALAENLDSFSLALHESRVEKIVKGDQNVSSDLTLVIDNLDYDSVDLRRMIIKNQGW